MTPLSGTLSLRGGNESAGVRVLGLVAMCVVLRLLASTCKVLAGEWPLAAGAEEVAEVVMEVGGQDTMDDSEVRPSGKFVD